MPFPYLYDAMRTAVPAEWPELHVGSADFGGNDCWTVLGDFRNLSAGVPCILLLADDETMADRADLWHLFSMTDDSDNDGNGSVMGALVSGTLGQCVMVGRALRLANAPVPVTLRTIADMVATARATYVPTLPHGAPGIDAQSHNEAIVKAHPARPRLAAQIAEAVRSHAAEKTAQRYQSPALMADPAFPTRARTLH